jgi:hypothetical protein
VSLGTVWLRESDWAVDLYAIPEGLLPIDQYIEFQAPDPDLASSYLYAQARAELQSQRVPSRAAFRALYEATTHAPRVPDFAVPDIAMHPHPSQMDRSADLRRALEEVKFWVVHGRTCAAGENREPTDVREAWHGYGRDVVESVGDWSVGSVVRAAEAADEVSAGRLWRFADGLSWVDAWAERRWARQMQVGGCMRAVDWADGRRRARWTGTRRGQTQHSERVCHWDARRLEDQRSKHQEWCLSFLERQILSPATPQLPHPAVVLDVVPVVRAIVAADNAFEAEAAEGVRRDAGRVRTSARMAAAGRAQSYVRYLTLHRPEKHAEAIQAVVETEYKLMS